jgi:hypothetical protein
MHSPDAPLAFAPGTFIAFTPGRKAKAQEETMKSSIRDRAEGVFLE